MYSMGYNDMQTPQSGHIGIIKDEQCAETYEKTIVYIYIIETRIQCAYIMNLMGYNIYIYIYICIYIYKSHSPDVLFFGPYNKYTCILYIYI